MTPDEIERHESHLSEFSRSGGSLRGDARNATVNNPVWFIGGDLTYERQQFHARVRVRAEFREEQPNVLTDRKAIVLAGPPGAGKSTVLGQVIAAVGGSADQWRVIDADHFKDVLLREAIADGSYEGWLVPDDVRVLHDGRERFYPRELASLVHDESSQLSKGAAGAACEVTRVEKFPQQRPCERSRARNAARLISAAAGLTSDNAALTLAIDPQAGAAEWSGSWASAPTRSVQS